MDTNKALWWSKNGELLAYLTLDNKKVPYAEFPMYARRQYPGQVGLYYPKTGSPDLPMASLTIWNKMNNTAKKMVIEVDDFR